MISQQYTHCKNITFQSVENLRCCAGYTHTKNLTKKKKPKNHFLAKTSVFWTKNAKIFKNKKLIKSEKTFPRYMYLDGFGKFLVIFVQNYSFYPC